MNKTEFLQEYKKLKRRFPYVAHVGYENTNCEYTDNVWKSTNCYYVFESFNVQDCIYCEDHGGSAVQDVDCRFGLNGTGNCQSTDFIDSSNCFGSTSFARCYNLWYSWYCVDSHDCFACVNLHNKSYCAFNIQYTKKEYEALLPKLKAMPRKEVLAKRAELIKKFPQLHSEHFDNKNSEYCDYAYYCTNCYYCFDCARDEDSGYLVACYDCKDSWDMDYSVRTQQSIECTHSGDLYNCYNVTDSSRCIDSAYLEDCADCHDCFGCVKLDHKSYCILNVQYTKEEYVAKLAKLKQELGLNFNTNISA